MLGSGFRFRGLGVGFRVRVRKRNFTSTICGLGSLGAWDKWCGVYGSGV